MPNREPLLVFGYGSLMWDPGVPCRALHPARVFGWHRRFSLTATRSWGSQEKPGLAAGLHPGGSSAGLVLEIDERHAKFAIAELDRREAHYRPRRVSLRLSDGRKVEAMTYVADQQGEKFTPKLPEQELMRRLLTGEGRKGSSLFYLEQTAAALERHGFPESDAHRLLARVQVFATGTD